MTPRALRIALLLGQLVHSAGPTGAFVQSVSVQVVILALSMATGVLTARYLGPDGRGVFAAVTTWPQMFAALAVAGLGNAMVYRLRKAQTPEAVRATAAAGCLFGLVTSTVFLAIGLVVVPLWLVQYGPEVHVVARVALVGTYLSAAHLLFRQLFAGHGAYGLANLCLLLPQLFYLVILLFLIVLGELTPAGAIYGLIGGLALSFMILLPAMLGTARPILTGLRGAVSPVLSYASRAAPNDLIVVLGGSVDKLVLIGVIGPAELGLYAVAFSFSRVIMVVQPAIGSVVFSTMSARTADEARVLFDHGFRLLAHGLLALIVVLVLIDARLLALVYGDEFRSAALIFRVLLLDAAMVCLSGMTEQLYFSEGRPGIVSIAQAVAFACLVVVLALLVPAFGATGAAVALLVASTVKLVILQAGIRLGLKQALPRLRLGRGDLDYLRDRLSGLGLIPR